MRKVITCSRWLCLCLALQVAAGTSLGEDSSNERFVNFNFDKVDIRLLIKIVGEETGKRFVVDEAVTGKVTVVTPEQIPLKDVYPLFLSILESSGYSVVKRQDAHHVVPLPQRTLPSAPVVGPNDTVRPQGVITKVFKLNHISVLELRKVLEPMVPGGASGALAAFGPTNHLILTDTLENIERIEKIIAELDQAGQARTVEVVQLKHAAAEDIAREITLALRGGLSAGEKLSRTVRQVTDGGAALPTEVALVPTPHANSLVLVGTPIQLTEIKRVISEIDVEGVSGRGRLNAIFLKYLSAEEASKNLTALLAQSMEKDERQRISIQPSIANNALLVEATPRDYEVVRELVEQLDKIPQQVLVEVIVAEVTSGDELDLGVELSTIEAPQNDTTTVVGRSVPGDSDALTGLVTNFFPQGLTFALARGVFTDPTGQVIPRVPFILQALAQEREVSILANVPLWAENNTEASVSVVDDIPILTSTIEGSGTARDVIQTIDRLDVGLKLTLTPHINPDREVRLQLNPRVEAIVDQGPADQQFAPTIAKREVSTTVTIPDRSTVIISGLIREDTVSEESKIPFLGDIPLIGFLFRNTSDRKQRTNLLIFVTPYIVTDPDEAAAVRAELEERTGLSLPDVRLDVEPSEEE